MSRDAVEEARRTLADALERSAELNATLLAKRLYKNDGYIRDFLNGKKQSLGAIEVPRIEMMLDLRPGALFGAGERDQGHTRDREANGDSPNPSSFGVPADGPSEPRMIEGSQGRDVGEVPKGAILEVDVRLGMGGGGITRVTDLMNTGGESYAAEGIKALWQLPPDAVRALFRVPPHRIRCFEAHGDSMKPTISDGDFVFVDIGHRVPSPPGIYAIADSLGGVILKRVEISSKRGTDPVQVRLISDNPHHTPEETTLDEITITGRYLGRLTTS